jgi:hypothetical protein
LPFGGRELNLDHLKGALSIFVRHQIFQASEFLMKGLIFGLAVFFLSTTLAHAAEHSIVGVVTRVEPAMIEVATDSGDTRLVTLDPDTKYMKWIMEKSWAQDPRADESFLRVGERVRIRVLQDEPCAVARKVWIVVGPERPEG